VASHIGNKGRYFSVRIANIAYVVLCVAAPLDYKIQAVLDIFFTSLDQFTACKNISHWLKA
jgi:hypothetical protein